MKTNFYVWPIFVKHNLACIPTYIISVYRCYLILLSFFPGGYRLNAPHLPEMIDSNYHNDTTVVLEQIDELEPKYVKGGPEPNEHIPVPSPPSSVLTHLENNEFPLGKGVFIDFTFLLVIISEVIIGIIFVIRRKRK